MKLLLIKVGTSFICNDSLLVCLLKFYCDNHLLRLLGCEVEELRFSTFLSEIIGGGFIHL